jgi:hypothetical protein
MAAEEARGGGEGRHRGEHRGGGGGGGLGVAAISGEGQVGGAAQRDEGESVDVVGGGEEACGGRNQAEAEAAMEDRGELWRDWALLASKRGGGGVSEVRKDPGVLYIAEEEGSRAHGRARAVL